MGYVAAFKKQDFSTPAAIVITETAVDVLIFPFVDPGGDERLLIAAHVSLDLWKANAKIEHNCLVLLAYLAFADLKQYKIILSTAKDHEKMRRVEISTDTTSWQQQLEEKNKQLQEAMQEKHKAMQEKHKAMQEKHKAMQEKHKAMQEMQEKDKAMQEKDKAMQEAMMQVQEAMQEKDKQIRELKRKSESESELEGKV